MSNAVCVNGPDYLTEKQATQMAEASGWNHLRKPPRKYSFLLLKIFCLPSFSESFSVDENLPFLSAIWFITVFHWFVLTRSSLHLLDPNGYYPAPGAKFSLALSNSCSRAIHRDSQQGQEILPCPSRSRSNGPRTGNNHSLPALRVLSPFSIGNRYKELSPWAVLSKYSGCSPFKGMLGRGWG